MVVADVCVRSKKSRFPPSSRGSEAAFSGYRLSLPDSHKKKECKAFQRKNDKKTATDPIFAEKHAGKRALASEAETTASEVGTSTGEAVRADALAGAGGAGCFSHARVHCDLFCFHRFRKSTYEAVNLFVECGGKRRQTEYAFCKQLTIIGLMRFSGSTPFERGGFCPKSAEASGRRRGWLLPQGNIDFQRVANARKTLPPLASAVI